MLTCLVSALRFRGFNGNVSQVFSSSQSFGEKDHVRK